MRMLTVVAFEFDSNSLSKQHSATAATITQSMPHSMTAVPSRTTSLAAASSLAGVAAAAALQCGHAECVEF
jgi:hypothetical protein